MTTPESRVARSRSSSYNRDSAPTSTRPAASLLVRRGVTHVGSRVTSSSPLRSAAPQAQPWRRAPLGSPPPQCRVVVPRSRQDEGAERVDFLKELRNALDAARESVTAYRHATQEYKEAEARHKVSRSTSREPVLPPVVCHSPSSPEAMWRQASDNQSMDPNAPLNGSKSSCATIDLHGVVDLGNPKPTYPEDAEVSPSMIAGLGTQYEAPIRLTSGPSGSPLQVSREYAGAAAVSSAVPTEYMMAGGIFSEVARNTESAAGVPPVDDAAKEVVDVDDSATSSMCNTMTEAAWAEASIAVVNDFKTTNTPEQDTRNVLPESQSSSSYRPVNVEPCLSAEALAVVSREIATTRELVTASSKGPDVAGTRFGSSGDVAAGAPHSSEGKPVMFTAHLAPATRPADSTATVDDLAIPILPADSSGVDTVRTLLDSSREEIQAARNLKDSGRHTEAEPLLRQALHAGMQRLGLHTLEVAESSSELGSLLQEQGKLQEAEPLLRQALVIREQALGSDHPDVASDCSKLGYLMRDCGQLHEAAKLLRRSLEISEAALGPAHTEVAMRCINLALLLKAQGELVKAEPFLRRAWMILQLAKANEFDVANACSNLGQVLTGLGKLDEAEMLLRQALVIHEQRPEDQEFAIQCTHLANVLKARGQLEEAEGLLRRALEASEKVLGSEHPIVAIRCSNLSKILTLREKHEEAQALQELATALAMKEMR